MTPDQKEAYHRELLEEAAKMADAAGRSILAEDLRALAASQPDTSDPTERMVDAGCAAWLRMYPAFDGEKPQPTAGDIVTAIYKAMRDAQPARAVDTGQAVTWTDDAEGWGDALNEAAWKFTEVCPVKSALLFNNCKPALREAILTYAAAVRKVHPAPLDAERVREAWAYRVHDFHIARSPVKARAKFPESTEHLYPANRHADAVEMARLLGGTCTPLYPPEDAR